MANFLPALEGLNQLLMKQTEQNEKRKKQDTSALLISDYNNKLNKTKTVEEVNNITTNFIAEAIKYGVPEIVNYAQSMQSSKRENATLSEVKNRETTSSKTYLDSLKDHKFLIGEDVVDYETWKTTNKIDETKPLADIQNVVSNTILEGGEEYSTLISPDMSIGKVQKIISYKNKSGKVVRNNVGSDINMYFDPSKQEIVYYNDLDKNGKPKLVEKKEGNKTVTIIDQSEALTPEQVTEIRKTVTNDPKLSEITSAFGTQKLDDIEKAKQQKFQNAISSRPPFREPDPPAITAGTSSKFVEIDNKARNFSTGETEKWDNLGNKSTIKTNLAMDPTYERMVSVYLNAVSANDDIRAQAALRSLENFVNSRYGK